MELINDPDQSYAPLSELTDSYHKAFPTGLELPSNYGRILQEMVTLQTDKVVHFFGSELELPRKESTVWMSPVEVNDGDDFSYFQLLYVNCKPGDVLGNNNVDTYLLDIDETSFKLAEETHASHKALNHLLGGTDAKLLIRWCKSGMAYFPRTVTPNGSKELALKHLSILSDALGIKEAEVQLKLSKVSEKEPIKLQDDTPVSIMHGRRYDFGESEIFTYGLVLEDDPWKYYDIFSPAPLKEIKKEDLLVRLDSGCDIGQIYNDKGCDCREQLHTALTEMLTRGQGLVVHVPGQDGRGYGAATKMETEGLKRGIQVATSINTLPPMDTVQAAKHLFGERYDIRTYDGAGRILAAMGISSIILQTDNRLKAEGLRAGGIGVTRKPTNTTGSNGSLSHILAKHKEAGTYYSD